jgi:hypothetical protein
MTTYYTKGDFKVGQEVVLGNGGGNYWRYRKDTDFVVDKVVKVGTKFITTEKGRFCFGTNDNSIMDKSNDGFDLYPSMEEFKKHRKRKVICEEVREIFKKQYGMDNKEFVLSDEKLVAIAEIIGIKYE